MASYTYSLTDPMSTSEDASLATLTAYFGTASLAAINASQSADFAVNYVLDNMDVNTAYLEWKSYTTDTRPSEDYSISFSSYYATYYSLPVSLSDLSEDTTSVFETSYYSLNRKYWAVDPNGYVWYLSGSDNGELVEYNLATMLIDETLQMGEGTFDSLDTSEMTVVFYSYDFSANMYYPVTEEYRNMGVDDPIVSIQEDDDESEATAEGYTYYDLSYADGELEGIRNKFGAPEGSTSLSLMQSAISSSVSEIYNTTNISRFNFNKTRAETLEPQDLSSIDILQDFNVPYKGVLPNDQSSDASSATFGNTTGGGY